MSAIQDPQFGAGEKISKKDPRFVALLHDVEILNPTEENLADAKKISSFTGILNSEIKTEKFLIRKMKEAFSGDHMTDFLNTTGVGDKTVARLAGEIGHPVFAFPHHWEENPNWKEGSKTEKKRVLVPDEPFVRNVGKLWAYCGVGDASLGKRKGMDQEDAFKLGNPRAKSLIYLMASNAMKLVGGPTKNGAMKPRSPYRDLYEEFYAHYEKNRDEWTKAHRNNAAIRKVGKTMLRDFWVAARDDLVDLGVLELTTESDQQRPITKAA
jgi:hypothetical protein